MEEIKPMKIELNSLEMMQLKSLGYTKGGTIGEMLRFMLDQPIGDVFFYNKDLCNDLRSAIIDRLKKEKRS